MSILNDFGLEGNFPALGGDYSTEDAGLRNALVAGVPLLVALVRPIIAWWLSTAAFGIVPE